MKTQNENEFNNTASRQKGRIILFGILTLAIMVFIFVQSAMPDVVSAEESNLIVEIIRSIMEKASVSVSNQEMLSFLVRKCAHFTEYAVFGVSLLALGREIARSGRFSMDETSKKYVLVPLICWLFGTFYAVTDEIHQLFVPGRFGQFTDVVIDSMGVATGILFFFIIRRVIMRRVAKKADSNGK